MLEMNLDKYDEMTVKEAQMDFGWGYDLAPRTLVHRWESEDNVVMVGFDCDGSWCCEIEGFEDEEARKLWNMVGQGWSKDSPEQAVIMAVLEMDGVNTMKEEGNCEDAVNVLSYNAYQRIYGETPMMEMDVEKMDEIKGAAIEYVKANIRFVDFEWEYEEEHTAEEMQQLRETLAAAAEELGPDVMKAEGCADDADFELMGALYRHIGYEGEYEDDPETCDAVCEAARKYVEAHMAEYGLEWA